MYFWLNKQCMKKCMHKIENMPLQTSSIFSCLWEVSQSACFSSKILCVVIFWYRKRVRVKSSGLANAWPSAPGQLKICKCPTPGTDKAGKCPAVTRSSPGDALNSLYKKTVLRNRVCSIATCVFRSETKRCTVDSLLINGHLYLL